MNERYACGDAGALVAYVYEECEPEMRESIEAHLERCAVCSREIDEMAWTRRRLGAWVPPPAELGFQLPGPERERPLPWWRAPLPAWAQAAAALLVFGVGLSVGLSRSPIGLDSAASSQSADPAAVSQNELSEVEQRLRAEIMQLRPEVPAGQQNAPVDEIMQRVRTLIDESDEAQRREFTLRLVELSRDLELQRRVDLTSVRETLGQIQGVTGAEIRQQREAIDRINGLIRVSQQGR